METQTTSLQLGTWNARNLLTALEVAEWVRVHPKTVYRWIREGKLEAIQFGPRTFRIPEDAIGGHESLGAGIFTIAHFFHAR